MARSSLKNVMRLIDVAKEELPPEQSFLGDLKRSVELTDRSHRSKPSKTYKPSSMQCIRNMYYQMTDTEPDINDSSFNLIGICQAGSDIHEWLQSAVCDMKNNGIECEYVDVSKFIKQRKLTHLEIVSKKGYETKLYHKILNMSFLCDGIIRYQGRYYILEIKSENSNKFFTRNGVDIKHYNQAIAYSTAFGINEVLFLYVSRDTLDAKTFLFKVTDDMKQELVGKIEECDGYVKRKIAPPKPTELPKSTCTYCRYKEQCKRDGS